MLLERPHELRRVPHPAEKRGLVGLETRNVLLRRARAFEKLLLLGLEPVPRRDDLRERRITVENANAAQNLPFADLLRTGHVDEDVEMVLHERVGQHDNATELLYAAHQRNRAVLLLVVEEERTVRKPADKVIAPVLLANPVLSHVDIIPKTRLLYQFYCINKLLFSNVWKGGWGLLSAATVGL